MKIKNNTLDIIALSSSLICAVHCAAIPVVLSFSSLTSLHFLENPLIEWTFICLGVVFAITSLWPSYKKIHHNKKPLLYVASGFTFIALGRLDFTELWEMGNTVLGASLVSIAHYVNWKLSGTKRGHKH
ncbi:MerC domain-containing protein [Confluentibacter sediminis]|uniref:MerC domain-containing protein n=1 Tax=Confluentibacter sediminis TaxID=2219045 RepID=UPI000DAB6FBB|nr:MerC domain-containing protein [Confluentibacter sediminis]